MQTRQNRKLNGQKRHFYRELRRYKERGEALPNADALIHAYAVAVEENDTDTQEKIHRCWNHHVALKG